MISLQSSPMFPALSLPRTVLWLLGYSLLLSPAEARLARSQRYTAEEAYDLAGLLIQASPLKRRTENHSPSTVAVRIHRKAEAIGGRGVMTERGGRGMAVRPFL